MRKLALAVAAISLALPLSAYADDTTPPTTSATSQPPANLPPTAVPDSATVIAGRSVTIAVLANDTDDALPGPLAIAGTTGDGRVTFDATSVTFTARPTDGGRYVFDYVVTDGELTDTSTVTISITALKRRVTLTAPKTVVGLHKFRLAGRVTPARRVEVRLHRRLGSGDWRVVGRTTSDREGRFSFAQRPTRLDRLRFKASAERATSAVVDRQVVARPDVVVSGPLDAGDVSWSYRPGCPIGPGGLRSITITHLTYDGQLRRGRLVVAASAVGAVRQVFTSALARRFPFRQLVPADRFYAGGRRTPTESDLAAMRADNTSAFNCRSVTGNPYRLSQHSYGNAIDINTVRNPYVTASQVYPSFARTYLDRSHVRAGMLYADGVVASTFRGHGWLWGARWAHPDYQHFSSNGG